MITAKEALKLNQAQVRMLSPDHEELLEKTLKQIKYLAATTQENSHSTPWMKDMTRDQRNIFVEELKNRGFKVIPTVSAEPGYSFRILW
jgi:hypothetical protein